MRLFQNLCLRRKGSSIPRSLRRLEHYLRELGMELRPPVLPHLVTSASLILEATNSRGSGWDQSLP